VRNSDIKYVLGCLLLQTLLTLCIGTAYAGAVEPIDSIAATSNNVTVTPGIDGISYTEQAELGAPGPGTGPNKFGESIATWQDGSTSWLVAGAWGDDNYKGAAYLFSRTSRDAPWHQETRLLASDGASGDYFGFAVAASNNVVVVGVPWHPTSSGTGVVYTFTKDVASGKWKQESILSIAGTNLFGQTVAFVGDTLVVGAPHTSSSIGIAAVYRRDGASWKFISTPSPPDAPAGANFGSSVAIGSNRILIGAPYDSSVSWHQGSAYIFSYDAGSDKWVFEHKLSRYFGGSAGDYFGTAVAIAGDNAIVGAPSHPGGGMVVGFSYSAAAHDWIQQQTFQAADAATADGFGSTLAYDGSMLAIGASLRGNNDGTVYLYNGNPSSWSPVAELAGTGSDSPRVGTSVSILGNEVLSGAPNARLDFYNRGRVDVYAVAHGVWKNTQTIHAASDEGEHFGNALSISGTTAVVEAYQVSPYGSWLADVYSRDADGKWQWEAGLPMSGLYDTNVVVDGNTIVIGEPVQAFGSHSAQGAAYIYARSSTPTGVTWTQQASLIDSTGSSNEQMGRFVCLSGDVAVIGAPGLNSGTGGAFIFARSGTSWTRQATLIPSEAVPGEWATQSCALDGDVVILGAPDGAANDGAVYAFQRSGTTWTEKKKLVPSDLADGDRFGKAIALTNTTLFVSSPYKQVGSNSYQGVVYAFDRKTWSQQSTFYSPAPQASAYFGYALTADPARLIIGEPGNVSAYAYDRQKGNWSLQSAMTGDVGTYFGGTVGISNGNLLIGAQSTGDDNGGRAYIFQDDRIFANGFDP
jgi:FG-GAP repeat